MIYIGDQLYINYMNWEGKEKFLEFLNKKSYTLERSAFSQKQIDDLGGDGLFYDGWQPGSGEVKLSFRDLVYLKILAVLQEYGVKNEKFSTLRKSFYQEKQDESGDDLESMFTSEVAIGSVFNGTEVFLCFSASGEATFYDPLYFITLRNPDKSHFVWIALHSIINEILINVKKKPIVIELGLSDIVQQ
jgi:hypothetical protein